MSSSVARRGPPPDQRETFPTRRGRRAELALTGGSQLVGRVGETRDDTVALVVGEGPGLDIREVPLAEIAKRLSRLNFRRRRRPSWRWRLRRSRPARRMEAGA